MRRSLMLMLILTALLWTCKADANNASDAENAKAGIVMPHSRGLHGYIGYMAPPSSGELATLDPALLVTPPDGMEVGYVPIVTHQEDAGN